MPRILTVILVLMLVMSATLVQAEKTVKVVTSFTILGDLVKNVGGNRVEVVSLVGPDGDAHVFEPTPADAKTVKAAGLVVVNGLGFEGWVDRLIKTSGYKGPVAVAGQGVKTREIEHEKHAGDAKHEEKIDPHAWQNLSNGKIYVDNIAKALSAVDPEGAAIYKAQADAYNAKLSELDRWIKAEFSAIPKEKRRMITSHDALGYFGAAYEVNILSPRGMSTDSEPSAGNIAALIKQIRQEKITAVFVENVTDPRMVEQIAKESGVKVGGELYSDALSKPGGSAGTYIDMFKNNVSKIVGAMKSAK